MQTKTSNNKGINPTLTKRQKEVLDIHNAFVLREGYKPTIRTMCRLLQVSSTATVDEHYRLIRRKGYILQPDGTYKFSGNVSDGYHTFNELYDHRNILFMIICNYLRYNATDRSWKSKRHSDGSMYDGWFIAGINQEQGRQMTYHVPMKYWEDYLCEELEKAPEFDGHTPYHSLRRLKQMGLR